MVRLLPTVGLACCLVAGACADSALPERAEPAGRTEAPEPPADVDSTLAVQLFLSRLATSGLFDEPAAFALVLLEPSASAEDGERVLSIVEGIDGVELTGYSYWPRSQALADLQEVLAEEPALAATVTEDDLPFGYALVADRPVPDVETLVAELRLVRGIDRIIPLEMAEPDPTVVPDGWEVVAALDVDLAGIEHVAAVGDLLVAWSRSGVLVVDGNGAVAEHGPGPLEPGEVCCGSHRLVAAGAELVVLGDEAGPGAAVLDPSSGRWRSLPDRPVGGPLLDAVWTGHRVVAVVAAERSTPGRSMAATLDPGSGRWSTIDDPPRPINVGGLVAGHDRVILSGTHQGPNNNVFGQRQPAVFEFDGDRWIEWPPPPIDGQAAIAVPLAGGLVSWNYRLDSAVLDGEEWRTAPPVPVLEGECYPKATSRPGGPLAHGCGGLARFDEVDGRWREIPIGTDGLRQWRVFAGEEWLLAVGASTVYRRPVEQIRGG